MHAQCCQTQNKQSQHKDLTHKTMYINSLSRQIVVVGLRSIPMSVSVCLSSRISQKVTCPKNFTKFSVGVKFGRWSVLFRRQCNVLITSGFVDDVMFARRRRRQQSVYIQTEVTHGSEVWCFRLPWWRLNWHCEEGYLPIRLYSLQNVVLAPPVGSEAE